MIRRQDIFAPPALDAYANSIAVAVQALREAVPFEVKWEALREVADYFHEQATLAWQTDRKLPD